MNHPISIAPPWAVRALGALLLALSALIIWWFSEALISPDPDAPVWARIGGVAFMLSFVGAAVLGGRMLFARDTGARVLPRSALLAGSILLLAGGVAGLWSRFAEGDKEFSVKASAMLVLGSIGAFRSWRRRGVEARKLTKASNPPSADTAS